MNADPEKAKEYFEKYPMTRVQKCKGCGFGLLFPGGVKTRKCGRCGGVNENDYR